MENKILTIAEIGQAHDGSLGLAHSYIEAVAKLGVRAVKFQTHIAEAESSVFEPFRVNFSYEDQTRYDYWKRMEFTEEQWIGLKKHCDDLEIEFISSPFSNKAVELLEKLNVQRYKIGSGEVNNFLMIDKISQTGKPVILSSGMSSFNEIDETVQFLRIKRVEDISLMQCTTSYPTSPENWGLNVITELQDRYSLPVGFSDHSGDIYACLFAVALNASLLEFHVAFDKQMFGPDAKSSLDFRQLELLIKGIQAFELAASKGVDKSKNSQYSELKGIFEKSLAVNKSLKEGDVLTFDDLESKKPKGKGADANEYESFIGKKIKRDLEKWEFLKESDVRK